MGPNTKTFLRGATNAAIVTTIAAKYFTKGVIGLARVTIGGAVGMASSFSGDNTKIGIGDYLMKVTEKGTGKGFDAGIKGLRSLRDNNFR